MKNLTLQPLRSFLACCALAGLSAFALAGTAFHGGLGPVQACLLVALPLAAMLALTLRRVQTEDRVARLEVALCRERNARTQADQALAEADLLLARLAARSRAQETDPAGQMVVIHSELSQLQRQAIAEHPQLALRLELLCRRVERVTACLRNLPRAAEPG